LGVGLGGGDNGASAHGAVHERGHPCALRLVRSVHLELGLGRGRKRGRKRGMVRTRLLLLLLLLLAIGRRVVGKVHRLGGVTAHRFRGRGERGAERCGDEVGVYARQDGIRPCAVCSRDKQRVVGQLEREQVVGLGPRGAAWTLGTAHRRGECRRRRALGAYYEIWRGRRLGRVSQRPTRSVRLTNKRAWPSKNVGECSDSERRKRSAFWPVWLMPDGVSTTTARVTSARANSHPVYSRPYLAATES
jgi:hypothetical protein